jgi:hypothetical protein
MVSNVKAIRLILSVFFLLGILFHSKAQKLEKQQVDSLWWKQKTEKLGYAEEQIATNDFIFNPRSLPTWFQSPVFKYVILILITLILLLVLFKLFGKGLFVRDLEEEHAASHLLTESDLDNRFYEMDLELLLKKAVSDQNWAMAVRIRFLMVLKKLIEQQHIVWHKDLTNRQIAWQIGHQNSRNNFFDLIGYFEKVWYGDKQVSFEYYQNISSMFEDFKRTIHLNDKK